MKKVLLAILSLLCLNLMAQSENNLKEVEKFQQARVKEQIQWTHKYKGGTPNPEGRKNTISKFNKKGYLIEKTTFSRSGEVSTIFKFEYDKKGRKILNETEDKGSKSYFKQEFFYKNDLKVKEITENRTSAGRSVYAQEYSYNKKNQLSEIIKTNFLTRRIEFKWKYAYKKNKTIIEELKNGNQLTKKTNRNYNDKNLLTEQIVEDLKNNVTIKTLYNYDSKGNNIVTTEYRNDNQTKLQELKYDSYNNLIEIINKEPDGSSYTNNKYKYNTRQELEEELWHERNDDYSKKSLKYDEKGLLIEVNYYYALYKYQLLYKFTYDYY